MTVTATRRNVLLIILFLSVGLVLTGLLALAFGGVRLPLSEVWAGLCGAPGNPEATAIVREIRLPRILLAVLVGAALAVSGTGSC